MHRGKKISVVIPCYNEEKGIGTTCKLVPKFVDEILVVDNMSSDNSAKIATKHGARVVKENRKGYGYALKKGIESASGDIIITIDGDGTYPVEYCKLPIDYLINEHLDFVSCSRFPLRNHISMHWQNQLGNKIVSTFMKVLFFREFKDGLSGMWVFRKKVYPKIKPISNTWNLSEEIKIRAYAHPEVQFDEFRINYHSRYGVSKVFPLKVGLINIAYLFYLRLLVFRLHPFIVRDPSENL